MLQVKGFSECMQALRPGLDAVHDVTIAYHNYKDGGAPSEKTLLAGGLTWYSFKFSPQFKFQISNSSSA